MNRRFFLSLMGLGFLASTSIEAIAAAKLRNLALAELQNTEAVMFYVAPNGCDRWSGTKKAPFATLHRVRAAIRELKVQQGMQQPVIVWLRGGTYFLSEPLELTAEDSGTADCPITYRAYPGENPVLSGGRPITNWQQGKIWVANLPEVKTGTWYFRSLRVGGDWAIRARYPNFEPENPTAGGWLYNQQQDARPVALEEGRFNAGVARIHNQGDRLEWEISIPQAGKYRVWLRYGNNMQAYGVDNMGGRTALLIDENTLTIDDLPDTGSFSTLRWQSIATVYLDRGTQTLTWKNLKGGGLSLDAFCLTRDLNWNPTEMMPIDANQKQSEEQPELGSSLIIVHAETFKQAIAKDLAIFPEVKSTTITTASGFPQWQNWDGAEIHIFPDRGWVNAIVSVDKVDRQSNTIYTNSQQNLLPGNRFFITNTLEALDSPNEWYLDRNTGNLYYYADSSNFPQNLEVVAPKLDRLIVLQGDRQQKYVEYIHFVGLTFTDTNYTLTTNYYFPADAAIWMSATRNCTIEKCDFTLLGGYGVRLDRGSHHNQIIKNSMSQLGQGGIILTQEPFENTLAANYINNCGRIYKHVAGVYLTTGSKNIIAHNHIQSMPRYGISLKSLDRDRYSHQNIVEYNKIIDTNLETSDTGAIETLGRDKQYSGNVIRFNFIRNAIGLSSDKNGNILTPYFTWGIYLDDHSSGTLVYGNIIVNTVLGGIMIGGGKQNLIKNNIFVNGAENQIQILPVDEFMQGNRVRNNIIVYSSDRATLWDSNQNWSADGVLESDLNLYWHTGELNLAQTDRAITPKGNYQQWLAAGFDRHSLIAKPPFFNSLSKNLAQIEPEDFRLQPHSPILKQIDFQPIPLKSIGVRGFN